MAGPGWQIGNWKLAYNRGYGTPGKSLPWLTGALPADERDAYPKAVGPARGIMSLKNTCVIAAGSAVVAVLLLSPLFGVSPSFKPDETVRGSSLKGWHPLGQADWKVQNGEITGTAKPGGPGG